ncbi:MAG: hypothetical protein JWM47_2819 [Acidimicrobiales bacterium]|nr:hypothetical protein [Acidimicrobiales bacterium]
MRVSGSEDQSWDGPVGEVLPAMLGRLERGDEEFLVLERVTDLSGETFAQVVGLDGGWYVEHRDGSEDRRFAVMADDLLAAGELLTAWAADVPGWRDRVPWLRT